MPSLSVGPELPPAATGASGLSAGSRVPVRALMLSVTLNSGMLVAVAVAVAVALGAELGARVASVVLKVDGDAGDSSAPCTATRTNNHAQRA